MSRGMGQKSKMAALLSMQLKRCKQLMPCIRQNSPGTVMPWQPDSHQGSKHALAGHGLHMLGALLGAVRQGLQEVQPCRRSPAVLSCPTAAMLAPCSAQPGMQCMSRAPSRQWSHAPHSGCLGQML